MNGKNILAVALRVWFGLLFWAIQYDLGNWQQSQSLLQMTGNTFFLVGVLYLFFGWGNALFENSHGKNWMEAQYLPFELGTERKWLWFVSSLIFLVPALLITFYISFIKR